jgi:2-amino-4-hydroxy-6-hydroxymethyldihydropteridine diphosphokinase
MWPQCGGSKLPPRKPILIGFEHIAGIAISGTVWMEAVEEAMRHLAYIGLGANLPSPAGTPAQTLAAAIDKLSTAGTVVARSSLYRTEPVDYTAQPVFVNAAVALETGLHPEALLDFLLSTERQFGRDRSRDVPKGPRTLDLDLLLVDQQIVHTPQLTLPHPELARRRFVLEPLAEIAPALRHPVSGATMAELLAALPEIGPNARAAVQKLAESPDGATFSGNAPSMGRTP